MKNVYDVRMLLKKFGTFIYSRDRIGDLILMESELEELYKMNFISNTEYINGKLVLHQERNQLELEERRSKHE